jgi:shikimate kinase
VNPETTVENPETARAKNVVLVGLMGSGKSTIGRLTAHSLGFEFVDTDHLIVETAHRNIPQIFAAEGEAGFRQHESAALQSLLGKERHVIATGGGIVTVAANLPVLRQLGFVVWLNADAMTLYHRVGHNPDARPNLRQDPLGRLRELSEQRNPLYEQVCDMKITTDDLSTEEVAYGLAETVRVEFRRGWQTNPAS